MGKLEDAHKKLRDIRTRTDLKIRPTKHMKATFTDFAGDEKPLSVRYYQVQGILHLIVMKRFLLGDDTGLGKTLETIAALCYVWEKEPDRKVLILTTKSSQPQWVREFAKFTTGVKVISGAGTKLQREKARKLYETSTGPTVMVMGYRSAVQDFMSMQDWKDYIFVGDEATAFKNPAAQISQVCRHFSAQADRMWALTATLIKNNLMEGFGIYQVVVPGLFGMTKTQFMLYFCLCKMQPIPKGRQIPVIVGYHPEKIKEFKEFIDPYFLGRAKHEVATELPALVMREVEVKLTDQQEAKYLEALTGLLEIGDGTGTGNLQEKETSPLTAIIYCQQIVNDLALLDLDGESPKLEALIDLLTDGDLEDEKVIVYSRFKKMVDLIMPRLKKEKIKAVRITGDEDTKARDLAMRAFQNPKDETRVVCLTDAGSEAINLQAAKAIICIDTPISGGAFIQLVGRMIRIGSLHDRCFVIHLVARGKKKTVDHRVLEILAKKMHLIEAVLGKRIKGEGDSTLISADNDISDLFNALRQDAKDKS